MRRMISSTRISGLFTSITMASRLRRGSLSQVAAVSRAIRAFCPRVFLVDEREQRSGACLECRTEESHATSAGNLLNRGAQSVVADQAHGPRAELVGGSEAEPIAAVLDDFALTSS